MARLNSLFTAFLTIAAKGRREDYLKFLCALRGIIARTCRSDFFHTNHLPTAELYYDAVKLRALA